MTNVSDQATVPEGLKVSFAKPASWNDLMIGDSISVDGICLTVDELKADSWISVLMPETLSVTAFGKKVPGVVNLERAMLASGRFDGHFLQGHVDDIGKVTKVDTTDGYDLYVEINPGAEDLVVKKGSIAINGVSLTVADISGTGLRVSLIPRTTSATTLGELKQGDLVNIEYDVIGKYVTKIMEGRREKS